VQEETGKTQLVYSVSSLGLSTLPILTLTDFDDNDVLEWIKLGGGQDDVSSNIKHTDLEKVKDYADDTTTCRRTLILRHFGEDGFDSSNCNGTCDNCSGKHRSSQDRPTEDGPDATPYALELMRIMESAHRRNTKMSIGQLVDTYRGTLPKEERWRQGLPGAGNGKALSKEYVKAVIDKLLGKRVFKSHVEVHYRPVIYVEAGPQFETAFVEWDFRVVVNEKFRPKARQDVSAATGKRKRTTSEDPAGGASKRKHRIDDDPRSGATRKRKRNEDHDDYEPPVASRSKRRRLA